MSLYHLQLTFLALVKLFERINRATSNCADSTHNSISSVLMDGPNAGK